jgi:hypothetical protein
LRVYSVKNIEHSCAKGQNQTALALKPFACPGKWRQRQQFRFFFGISWPFRAEFSLYLYGNISLNNRRGAYTKQSITGWKRQELREMERQARCQAAVPP